MAYIYSINSVRESILNNKGIKCVYVNTMKHELVKMAKENNIKIKIVDEKELFNMVKTKCQGIVAEVEDYKYHQLQEIIKDDKWNYPFVILLDGLNDPHNLGAILRTCDAAGVTGVIIGKNRSVGLTDTVARVSTGAIEYVKVVEVTNLVTTIKTLKDAGFWIVGAEACDESVNYTDIKYDMPVCLIVGSEGNGISRLVKENCDFLVQIPMLGHVNSLNASVSLSILVYEIIKYRKIKE